MRGKRDHTSAQSLARKQHGAISRQQLLRLGLSAKAIDRGIEGGRWAPVFRGAYAWGGVELSQDGMWMAAILATDEEKAAISHESAVALYEVARTRLLRPIHLSVPAAGRRRERGGISGRSASRAPAPSERSSRSRCAPGWGCRS